MRLLIVDDERDTLDMLGEVFTAEGFEVLLAESGEEGLKLFREKMPDGAILDVNLPWMSGFDLGMAIRRSSQMPILFLTAHDQRDNRKLALGKAGGDRFQSKGGIFMDKPYDLERLVDEVKAMLRRLTLNEPSREVVHADLTIDLDSRGVILGGVEMALNPLEYELIARLAAAPRKVFTVEELCGGQDDPDSAVYPNTIVQRVSRVRKAFARCFPVGQVEIVRTHPCGGYQIGACRARSLR